MKAKFFNKILTEKEISHEYNNGIPIKDENEFSFIDWIPIKGEWYHIAIVNSKRGQKKYVNGELIYEHQNQ